MPETISKIVLILIIVIMEHVHVGHLKQANQLLLNMTIILIKIVEHMYVDLIIKFIVCRTDSTLLLY